MKITKSHLKQIIKEEITRLNEAVNLDKLTDKFIDLVKNMNANDISKLKLDANTHAQIINGSIPFKLQKRMNKFPQDETIIKAYQVAGAISRR